MELKPNNVKKLRLKKGLGQEELAKMLGITRQSVYYIELGKTAITADNQKKLIEIFNCSIDDLYNDNSSVKKTNTKMISIKYYPDILASAGTGCFVSSENFETINVDEKQLAEMGIKSSYNNIAVIKVKGYSMQPTLQDGDLLFVDSSKKEVYNDRIYIINENNNLKVKRLTRESPFINKAIVKSDNQLSGEYPPYEIDFEKMDKNFICGQVVFYCRSIK